MNSYTTYKARPRFGPESCEDNIVLMSHLRPVEHFLRPGAGPLLAENLPTNFGPPVRRSSQQLDDTRSGTSGEENGGVDLATTNEEMEDDESLDRYSRSRLANYLEGESAEPNAELFYCAGKCWQGFVSRAISHTQFNIKLTLDYGPLTTHNQSSDLHFSNPKMNPWSWTRYGKLMYKLHPWRQRIGSTKNHL